MSPQSVCSYTLQTTSQLYTGKQRGQCACAGSPSAHSGSLCMGVYQFRWVACLSEAAQQNLSPGAPIGLTRFYSGYKLSCVCPLRSVHAHESLHPELSLCWS